MRKSNSSSGEASRLSEWVPVRVINGRRGNLAAGLLPSSRLDARQRRRRAAGKQRRGEKKGSARVRRRIECSQSVAAKSIQLDSLVKFLPSCYATRLQASLHKVPGRTLARCQACGGVRMRQKLKRQRRVTPAFNPFLLQFYASHNRFLMNSCVASGQRHCSIAALGGESEEHLSGWEKKGLMSQFSRCPTTNNVKILSKNSDYFVVMFRFFFIHSVKMCFFLKRLK